VALEAGSRRRGRISRSSAPALRPGGFAARAEARIAGFAADFNRASSLVAGRATLAERVYEAADGAPAHCEERNGRMFVYGQQTWTEATGQEVTILGMTSFYPGWNSCARTATAILKQGGVKIGIMNGVRDVEQPRRHGLAPPPENRPDRPAASSSGRGELNHRRSRWRFCNAVIQPCTMDSY
jgi:hypothetical protein